MNYTIRGLGALAIEGFKRVHQKHVEEGKVAFFDIIFSAVLFFFYFIALAISMGVNNLHNWWTGLWAKNGQPDA